MYNKYFSGNEYHTPEDKKRVIWDRLSFGTSLYFKLRYIKILFRNRKFVRNNNYGTARWAESSFEILQYVEDCGGKIHIEGLEHVDAVKDEPVVFVSNHMGTFETMVFPCLIAPVKEVTFVVKDSLVTNKLFGPIMRARNPIALARKDSRKDLMQVLSEGQQKLAEGTSIIIFPQGTRKPNFIPKEFNSLGIKLAQKAKVKVVPMAIKTDAWVNGKLIKDLGQIYRKEPIHVKFAPAMEITGNGKEQHQICIDFIQEHFEKWNAKKTH